MLSTFFGSPHECALLLYLAFVDDLLVNPKVLSALYSLFVPEIKVVCVDLETIEILGLY